MVELAKFLIRSEKNPEDVQGVLYDLLDCFTSGEYIDKKELRKAINILNNY